MSVQQSCDYNSSSYILRFHIKKNVKNEYMKILFLVENVTNTTSSNLIKEFNRSGHTVDVIPYFSNKTNQCSIIQDKDKKGLLYKGVSYWPDQYCAALLWCWGTAKLGRRYLEVFEQQGVHVLNSTSKTKITDSKKKFSELMMSAQVPMPKTLCFDAESCHYNVDHIVEFLGDVPYVYKPDYGTKGSCIRFIQSLSELSCLFEKINSAEKQGFLIQEFIGNPVETISHYRV